MQSGQRLRAGIFVAGALGIIAAILWWNRVPAAAGRPELKPARNAAATTPIRVGENVQVSSDLAEFDHMGCALAADPSDPLRLFAASTIGDIYEDVAGYYSH